MYICSLEKELKLLLDTKTMHMNKEVIEKQVYTTFSLDNMLYKKFKIHTIQKGMTIREFFDYHINIILKDHVLITPDKVVLLKDIELFRIKESHPPKGSLKMNLFTTENKRKKLKEFCVSNDISIRNLMTSVIEKETREITD